MCAGWRLFKIPEGAKRGAARVTYNGNIPDFPDSLCWDVDLTFKVLKQQINQFYIKFYLMIEAFVCKREVE